MTPLRCLRLEFRSPPTGGGAWRHPHRPAEVWRWFAGVGNRTQETVRLDVGVVRGVTLKDFEPSGDMYALKRMHVTFRNPGLALSDANAQLDVFVNSVARWSRNLREIHIDVSACRRTVFAAHTIYYREPQPPPPQLHVTLETRGGDTVTFPIFHRPPQRRRI